MPISNGQISNNESGGSGTGATSLVVTSPDGSVVQVGDSSYNPVLNRLTIALRAIGSGGGMTNPMTSVGDIIIGGTASGGVAPPVRLGKGTVNQVLLIDSASGLPTWADNPGLYQYSKQRYVDPVKGIDAAGQSGAYGAPWKTVAYALTRITTGMIIVLLGQTSEAALTTPSNLTNIDIVAFGTRSALNGFTNAVTIGGIGAGSIRIQNLNMGGGLTRASTSTCGLYLYGGSIGVNGFNQLGNGYTEFNDCDASNGTNAITAGTFTVNAGKLIAPVVTGTGTFVSINNAGSIIGGGNIGTGCAFSCILSIWVAASTGFALLGQTGSTVLLDGVQFVRPDLTTLAPINLSGFRSIQYTEFNKAGSTLTGTILPTTDWFDGLGLLTADTITTATKMLVRKPTGEIAEQLIPTAQIIPIQFNVPVSSLFSSDLTETELELYSSAGSSQTKQLVQLCTTNGSITLDQVFCARLAVGKTINCEGRLVVYNTQTITQPNYYILIQLVGALAGSGQWVSLGDSASYTLSKVQYTYNHVDFSTIYTNLSDTAIEAVGIRALLLYGQANATALVDTLFMQGFVY